MRASDANFGIFDSLFYLLKVAEDGPYAHLVKSKDVIAINYHASFWREKTEEPRQMVRGKHGVEMAVL
ncbi:MAG: hypothetical protein QOJ02_3221 [Acidobacteriota bacterium]|jgi:hypothetical protein|nr:hypothetical protein [Acidobacteriota bacterium]